MRENWPDSLSATSAGPAMMLLCRTCNTFAPASHSSDWHNSHGTCHSPQPLASVCPYAYSICCHSHSDSIHSGVDNIHPCGNCQPHDNGDSDPRLGSVAVPRISVLVVLSVDANGIYAISHDCGWHCIFADSLFVHSYHSEVMWARNWHIWTSNNDEHNKMLDVPVTIIPKYEIWRVNEISKCEERRDWEQKTKKLFIWIIMTNVGSCGCMQFTFHWIFWNGIVGRWCSRRVLQRMCTTAFGVTLMSISTVHASAIQTCRCFRRCFVGRFRWCLYRLAIANWLVASIIIRWWL